MKRTKPIILTPDGPPANREALLRALVEAARNVLIREQAEAERKKAA